LKNQKRGTVSKLTNGGNVVGGGDRWGWGGKVSHKNKTLKRIPRPRVGTLRRLKERGKIFGKKKRKEIFQSKVHRPGPKSPGSSKTRGAEKKDTCSTGEKKITNRVGPQTGKKKNK